MPPHSVIDDSDHDLLISRLSRPLAVADREAFAAAARSALADMPVHGPGSNFRVLRDLQRLYFSPPSDGRDWNFGERPSKLRDGPAIQHDDLRRVPRKQHAR